MKRDNTLKYMTGFDSYDKSKQKSFENAKSFFINKIDKAIKNSQGETLEEASKKHAKIPLSRDVDEEERYFNSSVREYDSFKAGAQWQAERMYSEEELKEILKNLSLVNPVDLELTSDGHGEFPDGYKLTEKGINYIIEQIIKK